MSKYRRLKSKHRCSANIDAYRPSLPNTRYHQRYVDSVECSGRFSVNMWARISVDSPGVILHVEERLTSDVYIRILENATFCGTTFCK
jgi:hypothetical protein